MKEAMRRRAYLVLAALVIVTLVTPLNSFFCLPAHAAAREAGEAYAVNVLQLNVRSGPGKSYLIVAKLDKDTRVVYQKEENGWWLVDYPNGSGYVDGKFLRKAVNPENTPAPVVGEFYEATCKLRIRKDPSTKSKALGVLKKGAVVAVLSQSGEWSEINYKETRAWVATRYLKKKEISAQQSSEDSDKNRQINSVG